MIRQSSRSACRSRHATTPEFSLPPYARIAVNRLEEPIDPMLRLSLVFRVELLDGVRIDATWDWNSSGYWVSVWRSESGQTQELALRWQQDRQSLVKAVESLSLELY